MWVMNGSAQHRWRRGVGRRIRNQRQHVLGITQVDLAELVGVTQKTVSLWERGQRVPSHYHMPRLLAVLHMDVADLLAYPDQDLQRAA